MIKTTNRIIRWGFYLLFGLIPLLLTPWNYELFEYNKMMAVYILTAVIVTSWVVKAVTQKKITIAKTPLDIPLALFFFSQLVSAVFSIDPHVSWMGYYSRFNGGMWSVIAYVLLYYAFLSNRDAFAVSADDRTVSSITYQASGKKQKKNSEISEIRNTHPIIHFLKISLFTATLVAIYGVLERLGIDKHIWVQDVQNRVFSTLGQPNWLAAYLVALMPIVWAFAVSRNQKTENRFIAPPVLYLLLSILFVIVLLFTRSRSGLLGFAVADIVFWGLVFQRRGLGFLQGHALKNFIRSPLANNQGVTFGILHVGFALIIFLNGTGIATLDRFVSFSGIRNLFINKTQQEPLENEATPSSTGPALESGGTESGEIRKYVWEGAIAAWKSSPKTMLIGTGTETFAFAFYQFRPVGHNTTSEWDFLYNKAHNEYLNYLATTGVFGLGSYLLIIGVFIVWCIQAMNKQKTENRSTKHHDYFLLAIHSSLIAGWLSVLVTNFFGFSVVVTQLILFLFPAFIFALHNNHTDVRTIRFSAPFWLRTATLALGLITVFRILTLWYADTRFARGYQLDRSGLYGQASGPLVIASILNPNEPLYRDELATNYSSRALVSFSEGNATKAAEFASQALVESAAALRTSPNNVNFLKNRTKMFYTLSSLDPSYNAQAIVSLKKAAELSPNDPKIYYNLAILIGREGDNHQAIEHLKRARGLKDDYRDAYQALWVFYTDEGKKQEATAIIEDYLKRINPNDQELRDLLNA